MERNHRLEVGEHYNLAVLALNSEAGYKDVLYGIYDGSSYDNNRFLQSAYDYVGYVVTHRGSLPPVPELPESITLEPRQTEPVPDFGVELVDFANAGSNYIFLFLSTRHEVDRRTKSFLDMAINSTYPKFCIALAQAIAEMSDKALTDALAFLEENGSVFDFAVDLSLDPEELANLSDYPDDVDPENFDSEAYGREAAAKHGEDLEIFEQFIRNMLY